MKKDVEQRRRAEASRNSVEVKRRGLALGFDAIGIATLEANAHAAELDRWLGAGYAGTMSYLHRQAEKRKDPATIMPGAKVALVTLTNYFHGSTDPGRKPGEHGDQTHLGATVNPGLATGVSRASGRVAQYAWSTDYHRVLGRRLERLATALREIVPGAKTRCYVDAGPVPERELARRAGLGWIGKNTMLIDPERGSFTFIGVVLTDAALAPDLPFQADRCGTCRACLDACPTDAFTAPHVLDARRCISYLTIEHRGAFGAAEQRLAGEWLFGCDVCQDVCPWNVKFARPTRDAELACRPELAQPDLDTLLALEADAFEQRFGDTAFERPGAAGMGRNASAVLANRPSGP
jgi:epoxyqueuosine reductase